MFLEVHSDQTVYYVPVATTLCTKRVERNAVMKRQEEAVVGYFDPNKYVNLYLNTILELGSHLAFVCLKLLVFGQLLTFLARMLKKVNTNLLQ